MLNFVSRGLKVLAVLCTLLLQLAVLLFRRAARLLDQEKRSGAILGLIGVVFGPTLTRFTDVHPALQWFWPVLLGVPLVVVWFQLGKRSVSVGDRVPEAL